MPRLKTWWNPGRAQRLRIMLTLLIVASVIVAGLQSWWFHLLVEKHGSWAGVWHAVWRSGDVLTGVLSKGVFQGIVVGLGWSSYFRIRNTEIASLRLRRSEQKYRSIINHAGEAVFLLDERGVVQEWNKQAETLFGAPRRNTLGRRVSDLDLGLQSSGEITFDQIFDDVRRTGRSLTYEMKQGGRRGKMRAQGRRMGQRGREGVAPWRVAAP